MRYAVDFQDKVISVRGYKYYQFLNENSRIIRFMCKWYKPPTVNQIRLMNNSPIGRFMKRRRNISTNQNKPLNSQEKRFMSIEMSSIFEVDTEKVKLQLKLGNRRPNCFMTQNDYHLQRNLM